MSKAWKKIDLEGGGLQTANVVLARRMRRHRTAYLWWLLFPAGAHRFYLHEPHGGGLYLALSVAALGLWLVLGSPLAFIPLVGLLAFAVYDLIWIDQRVVSLNKQLRMQVYMAQDAAAPKGYRGRYGDEEAGLDSYIAEKEQEKAGIQPVRPETGKREPRRMPSFAEQEAMLRELAKTKKKGEPPKE